MKSAYELALERSGGSLKSLDGDKKAKIAGIEKLCKAKIAEAEFAARERKMKASGDPAKLDQIDEDLSVETASLRSKCEREKEAVRNQ
jgi:hypothetical protein